MNDVFTQWERFIQGLPLNDEVNPLILSSWNRCKEAGIDPDPSVVTFLKVPDEERKERLHASRHLVAAAIPHLDWVSRSMGEIPRLLCITDPDGIVLYSCGDQEQLRQYLLYPGYDWSERKMGTCGGATALASGRPVAVIGPEHYLRPFHGCTCVAAPIFGPDGEIAGSVDISTATGDGRPERLVLIEHVAYVLGRELELRQGGEISRRKDQFLGMLGHELRNPLAPIMHALDSRAFSGPDDAKKEELRQMMKGQVRQISRLLDDLMDIARINQGKLELRRKPVDLEEVIRSALVTVRPLCDAASLTLQFDAADSPLVVDGDFARLVQIVSNLLRNACKFTPAHGNIFISLERENHSALIRIRDTGVGIPPAKLGKIFERFTQIGKSVSGEQPGLGLGLTLVRHLADLHGGSVTAISEGPGKGSEFVVRLPVAAETSWESPAPPATTTSGSNQRQFQVLVVEDSVIVAEAFSELLQDLGHEVTLAESGSRALEILSESTPDIIFSDLSMPNMNGYELAKQVRARPELSNTPLVAMTGYGQPDERERAQKAGFDRHLIKPAEFDDIQRLFENLAGGSIRRR